MNINIPPAQPAPNDHRLQDLVDTTHYAPHTRAPNPHSPAAAHDADDEEVEPVQPSK